MPEPNQYKPTLLDRYGAGAMFGIRAGVYGGMVFVLIAVVGTLVLGPSILVIVGALLAAVIVIGFPMLLSNTAGATYTRFMVDGTSTPYVEQYSYQQSLVMAGRLDDALASFEAVIAENPGEIDPRVKAAELYDRDKRDHARAAELFREAQRIPTIGPGQYVYVTNRLVDLYTGPLGDPGRALVELRKLIERYPGSAAAEQAKAALATLKARHLDSI